MVDFFLHPLTIENIYAKMETRPVITFEEKYGLLVYIAKTNNNFEVYVFTRSRIINRFRFHEQYYYSNTFIGGAYPGKTNYVVLEAVEDLIKFHVGSSRYTLDMLINYLIMILCMGIPIYSTLNTGSNFN